MHGVSFGLVSVKTRRHLSLATLVLTLLTWTIVGAQIPTKTVSAASEPSRQAVISEAMKYLHYPYARIGSTPQTGFSCIGFVSYVFRSLGINMPGTLSLAMAAYPHVSESQLLPGDIVFFRNTLWKGVSHVAIYIGGGEVIHAENPNRGVNISAIRNDPVEGSYWQEHYLVAERPLVGETAYSGISSHGQQAVVDVPSLNLRSAPSLNATVVTVMMRGTEVSVLGSWSKWLHLEMSQGVTGWAVAAGLDLSGKSTVRPVSPGVHTYPVLAGVNIHAEPSISAHILAVTTPNMMVSVLSHSKGFTEIRTSAGVTGWVLARFVDVPDATHASSDRKGTLAITAHLRTGPSLNAHIIEWVKAGTRVSILGKVPLWDHVRLNRKLAGYIYSEFVKG